MQLIKPDADTPLQKKQHSSGLSKKLRTIDGLFIENQSASFAFHAPFGFELVIDRHFSGLQLRAVFEARATILLSSLNTNGAESSSLGPGDWLWQHAIGSEVICLTSEGSDFIPSRKLL